MSIGERIKKLRMERGMSRREMAKKMYLDRSTIKCWELDRCAPQAGSIVAICKEFGVSADWLLGMEDEKE